MLQTSGEVFVLLFLGVGTLMVMKIYSGTIVYVFNDMDTLNMMMIFLKMSLFPVSDFHKIIAVYLNCIYQ